MSAIVKVFYHQGISQIPFASGTKYATDSVGTLKQPYISRATVTVDNATAQSVTAAPAGAGVALVQVQTGKAVRVEVNPPNRTTAADADSMTIRGDTTFVVGPDWAFSFLEDA